MRWPTGVEERPELGAPCPLVLRQRAGGEGGGAPDRTTSTAIRGSTRIAAGLPAGQSSPRAAGRARRGSPRQERRGNYVGVCQAQRPRKNALRPSAIGELMSNRCPKLRERLFAQSRRNRAGQPEQDDADGDQALVMPVVPSVTHHIRMVGPCLGGIVFASGAAGLGAGDSAEPRPTARALPPFIQPQAARARAVRRRPLGASPPSVPRGAPTPTPSVRGSVGGRSGSRP